MVLIIYSQILVVCCFMVWLNDEDIYCDRTLIKFSLKYWKMAYSYRLIRQNTIFNVKITLQQYLAIYKCFLQHTSVPGTLFIEIHILLSGAFLLTFYKILHLFECVVQIKTHVSLLCCSPINCCTASSKIQLSPFLKSHSLKKKLWHNKEGLTHVSPWV